MTGQVILPEFEYGAYQVCGCLVGLAVDMADAETARVIARWIKDGLHIERFPRAELQSRLRMGLGCKCKAKQPSLFPEESC